MRYSILPLALLAIAAAPPNTGPAPTPFSMKGGTAPARAPFAASRVATLDNPVGLAFLPDGRMLVAEKPGRLRLVTPGGKRGTIAGVPPVAYEGQGGLLAVALSPGFAGNRQIYLSYAEPGRGGSGLALARATLALDDAGGGRLEGLRVIWRQTPAGRGGQFGGAIAFSPDGGYLFLSSGERQRFTPAQDPDQALGKIERLTLDGAPAPGNPEAGQGPVRSATWTSGHRNPYGLAFDGAGRLWEIEMGPRGGDELNLIERGANYGWPEVSNGDNYDGSVIPDHPTRPAFAQPRLWWNPVISPSGLLFYSGSAFPAWRGSLLATGLSSQALVRIGIDDAGRAREIERFAMGARNRGLAQAPDGAIWLVEDGDGGKLLRLAPR